MEGVWATIFICHLIFGGHLLNIPKKGLYHEIQPFFCIVNSWHVGYFQIDCHALVMSLPRLGNLISILW